MHEKRFFVPFTQNIPFKFKTTGDNKQKSLIVYLHGYKQNMNIFEKKISNLLELPADHVILQGPYPIYDERGKRKVKDWGRAWYLYDGGQEQFKRSMEKSAAFIDEAINKITDSVSDLSITIFGYSMGGYLAGYYALSRPKTVDNLIVTGGRIKTEWFSGKNYESLNTLALHGLQDKSVQAGAAEKSVQAPQKMGASVTFRTLKAGHRLNETYTAEAKRWLSSVLK